MLEGIPLYSYSELVNIFSHCNPFHLENTINHSANISITYDNAFLKQWISTRLLEQLQSNCVV